MNKKPIVKRLEESQLKKKLPEFKVGDTVRVHIRIIEGDKERTQIFQGTVIARKGAGASETFSVHRVAYGEGMERVFPVHSPRIAKIEVVKHGDVRRGKLYYLRGTSGKKSKVKGRMGAVGRGSEGSAENAGEAVMNSDSVDASVDSTSPSEKEIENQEAAR